jgi:hypothetical protein
LKCINHLEHAKRIHHAKLPALTYLQRRDKEAALNTLQHFSAQFDSTTLARTKQAGITQCLRDFMVEVEVQFMMKFAKELQMSPAELAMLKDEFQIMHATGKALLHDTRMDSANREAVERTRRIASKHKRTVTEEKTEEEEDPNTTADDAHP